MTKPITTAAKMREAALKHIKGATLIVAPENVSQRVGAESIRNQLALAVEAIPVAEPYEDCSEYLKEGETPAQRLASNHKEILTLMKLLEKEKRHSEVWVKAARDAESRLARQGDEIEALIKSAEPDVQVKELEWRHGDECLRADSPFGRYEISDGGGSIAIVRLKGAIIARVVWTNAKAAAQADFERRIRECLK